MTDDEQRHETRDLVRFFGATVEAVAEWLEIEVDHAAALCAEVGEPAAHTLGGTTRLRRHPLIWPRRLA